MWIDDAFPGLDYQLTSNPTDDYNCIAYAAGDTANWWSHLPGYRWPNAERSPFIESLVEVFESLGFETCEQSAEEAGYQKVALYAKGRFWKHAAIQLPGGTWSSKLGPDEDISHSTPEAINGDLYGAVHCIMRRAR